ncbi:MAG: hypothetical protein U0Q18_12345 [Bryobacteraceae bacterium]
MHAAWDAQTQSAISKEFVSLVVHALPKSTSSDPRAEATSPSQFVMNLFTPAHLKRVSL